MDVSTIMNYQDFRVFLHDLYQKKKKTEKKYSYRQFAQDLGFTPSNFLHLVISHKRNLSNEAVQQIKSKLKGSAQQKKYFENLVLFNQSTTPQDTSHYHTELEKIAGKMRIVINPDQYAYFSTWYIPVLREIISLKNCVSNLNWLSKKLKPSVPENKIKEAIAILERLKMIKRVNNRWVQSNEHLTTPTEVTSTHIMNFHKEMLGLSLLSLDMPSEERDVSTMTMSLSKEQYDWLKQRIIDFRDEIQQELQGMESDPTLVAQLNIQVFPVTKI